MLDLDLDGVLRFLFVLFFIGDAVIMILGLCLLIDRWSR